MTLTIAERLDLRSNSLNVLRLLLATLVIVSHSFPISGNGNDPQFGDIKLGTLAVGGFFAISGYLITASRFRTGFVRYCWRRFLRIFPGYWVCLIFTAFVAARIGGLVRGGWDPGSARDFVVSSLDMYHGSLLPARTLAGAPLVDSWNGSLWTLGYEIACYIIVGIALLFGFVRSYKALTLVAFMLCTLFSVVVHARGVGGLIEGAALLMPFFLSGAVLLMYADRVHLTARWAIVSAGALFVACIFHLAQPLGSLPLAYILLWLAVALPLSVRRIGSKRDFSYGMYLYAFPVQQLLVLTSIQSLGVVSFIFASVLCTIPCAVLSVYVVEGPSMRLKDVWRGPRAPELAQNAALSVPPTPDS